MIQYKDKIVTVFESAMYKTTCTVVHIPECIILVDPNWLPQEINQIKQYIQEIRGDRPLYLLFTHSDYDHIIGYGAFPEATIIASQAFDEKKDKQMPINACLKFDDEYYVERDYSIQYPSVDVLVNKDKQTLLLGARAFLRFYLAPGHTNDSVFAVLQPYGIFISGDYLSDVEFPYIYHNSADYENTMHKVDTILDEDDIYLLIPGHGHVTNSLGEIDQRKDESLAYISALRTSIQKNTAFDNEQLWKKYKFPISMEKYHNDNITLIKKEMSK